MDLYRTERDFNEGVVAIQNYIVTATNGIHYKTADKTTNNFDKFKEETKANGYITVSTDGCDNTIYSIPRYNVLARLWHDTVHLKLDAGFDAEGELLTCERQQEEMVSWLKYAGYDSKVIECAQSILYLDIMSQVAYYERYNRFVPHQRIFVMNEFLNNY